MPFSQRALDSWAQKEIKRWARVWASPSLADRVQVVVNHRLSVSLARSMTAANVIELSPGLLTRGRRLRLEVLCHEAAHLALSTRVGPETRPHGQEWAELMRAAGFEPRATFASRCRPDHATGTPRRRIANSIYEHRCPVCQFTRRARRPVSVWLCKRCVETGLPGKLLIRRHSVEGAR